MYNEAKMCTEKDIQDHENSIGLPKTVANVRFIASSSHFDFLFCAPQCKGYWVWNVSLNQSTIILKYPKQTSVNIECKEQRTIRNNKSTTNWWWPELTSMIFREAIIFAHSFKLSYKHIGFLALLPGLRSVIKRFARIF